MRSSRDGRDGAEGLVSNAQKRSEPEQTRPITKAPRTRWGCEVCGDKFRLKKELVEHAKDEVESAYQELSLAESQLEDLGVKSYDLA